MEEKEIQHKVTKEDLVNNPELAEAGVEVGEIISLPAEDTDAPDAEVPAEDEQA